DREHRLQVGHVPAGAHLQLAVGGRKAGLERLVDEPPDLLERDDADELLDVDAAVPELPALAVGLGDLRLERDDAREARREIAHARAPAADRTSAAPARSPTATPPDLHPATPPPPVPP